MFLKRVTGSWYSIANTIGSIQTYNVIKPSGMFSNNFLKDITIRETMISFI